MTRATQVLIDSNPFPEDHVCPAVSVHEGTMCHVRYFHDSHGSPTNLSGTHCSAWSNNACCTREIADNHQMDDDHLALLYTDDYSYAKCGPVSEDCARWFLAESCLYECDVNVGRYRAHVGDAGCEDGGNEWMIRNMPLKVSGALLNTRNLAMYSRVSSVLAV